MIYRYPRYGELYDAWQRAEELAARAALFGAQEFRDLQMWSQLAWFDEEFQADDPEVRELDRSAGATSPWPTSAAWARSSARSWAR